MNEYFSHGKKSNSWDYTKSRLLTESIVGQCMKPIGSHHYKCSIKLSASPVLVLAQRESVLGQFRWETSNSLFSSCPDWWAMLRWVGTWGRQGRGVPGYREVGRWGEHLLGRMWGRRGGMGELGCIGYWAFWRATINIWCKWPHC